MKNLDFQPVLFSALKTYNKKKLFTDLLAGTIVGVVALPLCIAFGIASGVSPEQGLITGFVAGFIASFMGGSAIQISGPTGALSVIVFSVIAEFGTTGLIMATIMAGIILILMGVFRLGNIIKFIPFPIIVGFNSGIALLILTSQIKDLLGLSITTPMPADFLSKWALYFQHIDSTSAIAITIALLTIILIRILPRFSTRIPGLLVTIVLITLICYILRNLFGIEGISTIGDHFRFSGSLPALSEFSFSMKTINQLLPTGLTIAILAAIVSLMSATVADGATGQRHNSNTELIALGVANIITPLFGGIPATGAIARTMTNINNGGKTPMAGIIHALMILLILLFLGPLATHIPMACLAGMLAVVAYNMSEWRTFRSLVRSSRLEGAVLISTFLLTVIFNLTIAIEVGLLLAMILFLKRVSETTHISVNREEIDLAAESESSLEKEKLIIPHGVEVYEIDGPFFFGVANKFDECMKTIGDKPKIRIIRMRRVPFIDTTGLHNLEILFRLAETENIRMILSGVNEPVRKTIEASSLAAKIGNDNICSNIHQALKRSEELMCP